MPKPADWDKIKAAWETGETAAKLALRFHLKAKAISGKAGRDGWDKSKQPPKPKIVRPLAREGKRASKVAAQRPGTSSADFRIDPRLELLDAAQAEAQHLSDYQRLRKVALAMLGQVAEASDAKLLSAVAIALKTVQDGQRKTLRLDAKGHDDHDPEQQGVILLPVKELGASPQIGSSD